MDIVENNIKFILAKKKADTIEAGSYSFLKKSFDDILENQHIVLCYLNLSDEHQKNFQLKIKRWLNIALVFEHCFFFKSNQLILNNDLNKLSEEMILAWMKEIPSPGNKISTNSGIPCCAMQ